jgi:hypothetical protein
MEYNENNKAYIMTKLERAVYDAASKLTELKLANKKLKDEVNELRRLLALNEKKADRLKNELLQLNSANEQDWQVRERKIRERLRQLATKVAAFEKIHSIES